MDNISLMQQIEKTKENYSKKYGINLDEKIGAFNLSNLQIANLKSNIKLVPNKTNFYF